MIISNKIEIRINPSNINHYKNYYNNITTNDLIFVNVNELTKGSSYKIKMKCDICDYEYESAFNVLYKNNSLNYTICEKCKRKNTIQEKYGVDNIFQSEKIKEKSKDTIKEKYGVENVSQNEDIKSKKKKSFLIKYGVEWGLSSDIIKDKSKETLKEKYGVENISKLESIKIKKEDTCFKNHGVKIISQHANFKINLNILILKKLQEKYENLINISGDNFTFFVQNVKKTLKFIKKLSTVDII